MTSSENEFTVGYDPVKDVSITIDSSYINTLSISDDYWITANNVSGIYIESTPFVNYVPSVGDIEEMSKEYPALAKAYENFKTVYAMVEQDWKGKQNE